MSVLFCGTRTVPIYLHAATVMQIRADLTFVGDDELVIHGGATGVDELAGRIAAEQGLHVAVVKALWDIHGRAAGHKRNAAMLQLRPRLVIAYFLRPNSRGTSNMVAQARTAGVPVYERVMYEAKVSQ